MILKIGLLSFIYFPFGDIKFSSNEGNHICSIGSLGKSGENDTVEDIHVKNCTLTETLTGVRIKTWQVFKQYY